MSSFCCHSHHFTAIHRFQKSFAHMACLTYRWQPEDICNLTWIPAQFAAFYTGDYGGCAYKLPCACSCRLDLRPLCTDESCTCNIQVWIRLAGGVSLRYPRCQYLLTTALMAGILQKAHRIHQLQAAASQHKSQSVITALLRGTIQCYAFDCIMNIVISHVSRLQTQH